jgi:hypothetical protein
MLPSRCLIAYSRWTILLMCSAIVASVPTLCRQYERGGEDGRRTYTVLVHETDEISFREQLGRRSCSFLHLDRRGHERLSHLELGEDVAVPLVVDVHVEVVAMLNHESYTAHCRQYLFS